MPTAEVAASLSFSPPDAVSPDNNPTGDLRRVELKAELRRNARLVRERAAMLAGVGAAAAVARNAVNHLLPAWNATPRVVGGYWPLGSELDCRPLLLALAQAGWRSALPVMAGDGLALGYRAWTPGDSLVAARFGVLEPAPAAPPLTPTLVLVPLLAFDRSGHRLGYGGGYFDRTLAGLRAAGPVWAAGLAFAAQERPALPTGPHDQRLDAVVTEHGVIWTGREGRR